MGDDIQALRAENDHLRASLANSGGPCAYCALPKERWGECADGFPGCARGDDAMLCPHVGAELETREEVDALRLLLRRNEVRVGRERELLAETTRLLERARAAEAALAESERKRVEIIKGVHTLATFVDPVEVRRRLHILRDATPPQETLDETL